MKKIIFLLISFLLLVSFSFNVFAADSNIDGGGGGMEQGTNANKWTPGRDGVRITIVRDSDGKPVSSSVDFTNRPPMDIKIHFGKVSKISYRSKELVPNTGSYSCVKPTQTMPIIVDDNGKSNMTAIKSYFTDEIAIRDVADAVGFNYERLISGDYKILIEPMAHFKFNNVMYAMTAHEAAMYNQKLNNGLRRKMVALTSQNLPLAMFLEYPDLGFSAWSGATSGYQSDPDIISSLGMGIVRFKELPPIPSKDMDIIYRCDTDVITSITLSTGTEKTPDSPAYATLSINGRTYSHNNIYIPEDGSQLAWVKWRTPKEPCMITIMVTSNCNMSTDKIVAKIEDLNLNPPPDPKANDRNDSFILPSVPSKQNITTLKWGEWDCWWHPHWVRHGNSKDGYYWVDEGWWEYAWLPYSASLSANMKIKPDEKSPTATSSQMKSGYGFNMNVSSDVSSSAPSSHYTGMQNVVAYFPEFQYQTYWRLLDRMRTGYAITFEFKKNKYSTYNRSVHFLPVWFPDGRYAAYAVCEDAWTPAGMMSINLNDDITIRDSLFSDWHIRPVK